MGFFNKLMNLFSGKEEIAANSELNIAFSNDNAKKGRTELKNDYDFREEFEDVVENWENVVDELFCVADEWNRESDPVVYREEFNQKYNDTIDFLKNTVKPFLAEHSAGYKKSTLNKIYIDLLEKAKDYKKDFFDEEFPAMLSDYKEFLEEQKEE